MEIGEVALNSPGSRRISQPGVLYNLPPDPTRQAFFLLPYIHTGD